MVIAFCLPAQAPDTPAGQLLLDCLSRLKDGWAADGVVRAEFRTAGAAAARAKAAGLRVLVH